MVLPTGAELASMRAIYAGTSMHKSGLRESGSNWGIEHINALHVHRFDDIALNRFFPANMPANDDADFCALRSNLMAPTYRDLKRGEIMNNFTDNLFRSFFSHLSDAIKTGQAEDEGEDTSDTGSTPTGSSAEGEPEIHSELALKDLVDVVLQKLVEI